MRKLGLLLLFVLTGLLSLRSTELSAYDRQMPLVAHYSSEYARVGFILDRSSEAAKLKYDGLEEIFVLRPQPAAGGDRIMVRDDGEIVLRVTGLGGIILFTPQYRTGVPVAPDRAAPPLVSVAPPIGTVRDIAGRIMAQIRAETGQEIIFEADWNAATADPNVRSLLFDAIRNAGTAIVNLVRSGAGRRAVTGGLRRVRFANGYRADVFRQGDMAVVSFSVGQGIAGRPSSFVIARQLMQIMH